MKLKELESWLSQCEDFDKPKVALEQYATSAHIAARMLYSAQEHIEGAIVCDLGSGCGILSIGSVMMGAGLVYGFEVDPDAIQIALSNVSEILADDDDESSSSASAIQFIQTRISTRKNEEGDQESGPAEEDSDALNNFNSLFDVVIMNPPFGTKNNAGEDFSFLKRAIRLVREGGHVYTLHKTSTRPFFQKKIASSSINPCEFGVQIEGKVLATVNFNLPKSYKFHKEKSVDVNVDFWHFTKGCKI